MVSIVSTVCHDLMTIANVYYVWKLLSSLHKEIQRPGCMANMGCRRLSGFLLGLFKRALCTLGALMCTLGALMCTLGALMCTLGALIALCS